MKEKISIIVPIYNVEKYLNQCIDSIINQTYKNLEIILVDDGSPDNCPKICDDYQKKDNRIKVIHKQNGGLSDARNAGLEIATGDYIGFVDSDDYIAPDMYEKLLLLAESKDCEIAVCGFIKVTSKAMQNKNIALGIKVLTKEQALYELMCEETFEDYAWNKLYKKELFKETNIRYPKGMAFEDTFTTYKLFLASNRVVVTESPLYYYRINRIGSIIYNQTIREKVQKMKAYNQRLEYINDLTIKDIELIKDTILSKSVLLGYNLLNLIFIKDVYKKYKEEYQYIIKFYKDNKCKLKYNNYFSKKIKLIYSCYVVNFIFGKIIHKIINVIDKIIKRKSKINFNRVKLNNPTKKIFLLGTPEHNNIGDHAIAYAQLQLIKNSLNDYEIIIVPECHIKNHLNTLKKQVKLGDVICLIGGGNLGNEYLYIEKERRITIKTFSKNSIIIFPQTVYFSKDKTGNKELEISKKIYSKHKKLTIYAREEWSYNFLKKHFYKNEIRFCPDVVLSLSCNFNFKRENALMCLRSDVESILNIDDFNNIKSILLNNYKYVDITDMGYFKCLGSNEREKVLTNKLEQFSQYNLIITDRLHGMIFSIITGTPCIVIGNYNHKVEGVYKLVSNLNYVQFINSLEELEEAIKNVKIPSDSEKYSTKIFEKNFNDLKLIIKELSNN